MKLGLRQNCHAFRPGDEIAGAVEWDFDTAPQTAAVRLAWFTKGKGTEDAAIVETLDLPAPGPMEMRTFAFRAPAAPYSFSGKLISLIWVVELLLQPDDRFQRLEITIAPNAKEVLL